MSTKIGNDDNIDDPHVFQWGYWHELAHKIYLNISEKYNDAGKNCKHETWCNWLRTTQK